MTKIIDADGHIVEPRALWQEYIEPAYRDRIPQVAKDEEGIDRVQVEGKLLPRSPLMIAAMAIPGGLSNAERAKSLSWDDLRPGSYDVAYCICSVAVDLKISEMVDVPNFVVSAFLPLDIFAA